ncbi:MAG: hypothetical protein QOF78_274 [Phycisphaerales bacterium]|jgi:hypothetical protein|nr:hypothetical protein [Phycisphaerales bacterium]MEA2734340.1 hypothetical protein [Humisphaera sp.]
MPWFKSFGVIFGGMALLLLGDFAAKAGTIDPTVFRLAGAALMGLGVCIGLGATRGKARPARARKR